MKMYLRITALILVLLSGLSNFNAQAPCNISTGIFPSPTVCIGTPVTLNALATGINIGTGATGPLTVAGGATVFTDGTVTAVSGAIAIIGSNSISVASATGFSVGDEILIITMQDAATTNNTTGRYEFRTITSISANTLFLNQGLTNSYIASASLKHQVIEVPNYSNVTVNTNGLLTCSAWNGTVGGVLCFRANGTVLVNSGGSINANGKGYRGVAQRAAICQLTDGGQGEGIYGSGIGSGACSGSAGGNGGAWLAANGNGGGGGTGRGDSGGGGGGGYASAGTAGVNSNNPGGAGGLAVGNTSLTLLIMGGAGGEGGGDEDGGAPGAGGNGGGIVFFTANTCSLSGAISSNGNNGNNSIAWGGCGMAGGGGGAGGSVQLGLVSTSVSGGSITANGGAFGYNNGCGGNGGAGSTGRIRIDSPGAFPTTNPAAFQAVGVVLSNITYTWSTNANTNSISVSPSTTTNYTISVSATGCASSSSVVAVNVVQLPIVSANTGSLCAGQSFTLNANGAQTYLWSGSGLNMTPPTGGVITTSGPFRIHTFTSSGVFVAPSNLSVSALIVAGGGGGGSTMGGGGGGGGVIYLPTTSVTAGNLNVVVGAGGTGALAGLSQSAGVNGGNSSFNGTIAIGGGGGGSDYNQSSVAPYAAKNGGSGGGAPGSSNQTAGTGTSGQGFNGGGGGGNFYPGGGGGAGGTGSVNPGTGGAGIQYSAISPFFWGGGGGGSGYSGIGGNGGIGGGGGGAIGATTGGAGFNNGFPGGGGAINQQANVPGGHAGANTGGGGGGGSHYNATNNGGNGGSGIVIIRYLYENSTVAITPTATTVYTLVGTSSAGCISNPVTTTIGVGQQPTLSVTSGSICSGQSFALNPTGATAYTIQGGNAVVSPTANTTYTVVGSNSGCFAAGFVTATVGVLTSPTINITGSNTLCAGESIVLNANGASTYTWDSGSNGSSFSVSPAGNATYSVSGTSAAGCSGNTATLAVTVNTLPVIAITGTNALCAGGSVNLTANGASTYTWTGGANTSVLAVSPVANTSYTVSGRSAAGCLGNTATLAVTVNTLPVVSISGTNALCAGGTISLTANGANTYTWNGGSNASVLAVSPTSNTTYTLSGTSAAGCFGNTPTLAVTVNALPSLAITGNNTLCVGESVVLTANGANTYTWNGGANSSTLSVSPTTNTTYSLSGTSAAGCLGNTATITLTVNSLPVISITGTNTLCAGGTINLTANGAATYTWSGGSNTAILPVTPVSNATYSVSGRSALGCLGNTATLAVSVNTLPIIAITGTNALCAGGTISLTANGANTYTWNGGSNASVLVVSPTSNATYTLSGTSVAGCFGNTPTLAVTVNTLPVVAITGTNALCAGGSVVLTANGANTYTWTGGSNASTLSVSPASNSTYSLSGTSAAGCAGNTATLAVTVNTLPVVAITGTTALCAGGTISLTANGAATYTWNGGSNTAILAVTPVSNTTYSVNGRSAAGCAGNTATLAVTVNTLPVVAITGTNALCAGGTISLTASGANTYTWNGGSNATTLVASPTSNTTYSLSGTSAAGCLGNTPTLAVTVNTLPVVAITGTNAVCAGGTVNLAANGAATYTWNSGSNAATLSVSPANSTTYSLTGRNAFGCLGNTATLAVTVNTLPIVMISGASGICTGQTASLTASGASSYSWNTGSTNASLVTTPAANTTYTVIGINALGCSNTATQLVTVQLSLSVSISGPSVICEGQTANLSGLGGVTYTWNTGATTSTISPTLSSTATFSVIGASGSCSNTAIRTVSVVPNPTVSITGTTAICAGNTETLTASGATTYSWSNGSTGSTAIVTPSASAVYTVVGSYSTGCSNVAVTSMTVYTLPVISISGQSVICAGDSISLVANGADTYVWNTNATTASITVSPASTTSYSAVGTDTNGCSATSAQNTVLVNPTPTVISIPSASIICAGDSLSIQANGALFYNWNTGSTDSTVIVKPAGTTSYTVTGTNSYSCSSTAVTTVTVNALPTLVIAGASTICLGEETTFSVSGASTYSWSTGVNTATLMVAPITTTNYLATGTSTDGCAGTASVSLTVDNCTAIKNVDANIGAIRVYPNPNTGSFVIELATSKDASIVITNVLGQTILNQKAELFNQIDLSAFNKGLYFITVTQNNKSVYRSNVVIE